MPLPYQTIKAAKCFTYGLCFQQKHPMIASLRSPNYQMNQLFSSTAITFHEVRSCYNDAWSVHRRIFREFSTGKKILQAMLPPELTSKRNSLRHSHCNDPTRIGYNSLSLKGGKSGIRRRTFFGGREGVTLPFTPITADCRGKQTLLRECCSNSW